MKLRRTPTTGEPSREEPVEPDNFLGIPISRKEYKKQLATTEILRNEAVLSGLLEMRKNLPGSNLLEIFIRTASSEIAEQRERYSRKYGEFKIYLEVE
jgi:hypothetical protein